MLLRRAAVLDGESPSTLASRVETPSLWPLMAPTRLPRTWCSSPGAIGMGSGSNPGTALPCLTPLLLICMSKKSFFLEVKAARARQAVSLPGCSTVPRDPMAPGTVPF